jgi:hypothetical protein
MVSTITAAHEAIVLALVVLVLAALLGLAVLMYRRRYFSTQADRTTGFTLADIRQMHKDGQLSDEEYETMRQVVIGMETKSDG